MARKMGFRQSLTARWVFRSSAIRVSARKHSMPWRRMQRARRSLNGLRAMTLFLTIRTPKIILPPRIRRPRLKLRFGRVLRAVPLPAGYLGVMLGPNGRILAISLSASRHAWQRMHGEAEELLARFNVEIAVRQPLSAYTTAIQQMVAIARAVSFEAKLVIMDEPTSSLDDHEVAVLFDVVRQLKASGVAVIFVSHRLEELYVVCDRVTVMRDGRTVLSGALAGFTKLDLVTTMIGRTLESAGDEQTAFRESAHAEQRTSSRLLEVRNLSVGRKVTDASLQLSAGEIVGLAGLLGSGRTELARAVFGADRPDNGEMEYDGTAFAPATPAAAIGVGIGFCSEDRKVDGIVPDMSVRENLTLALLPYLARAGVMDREKQVEVVDRFIRRLAIKCSSSDQPIRELSGGNSQNG